MKRGYTALEYKSIVRRLRSERPDLSLTSDFIVGFPGETDADFAQTMKLVEDVGFDGAFSFAYSARPGTPAAELADPVPARGAAGAPRARCRRCSTAQYRAYSEAMVGTRQRVLVTGRAVKDRSELPARTENNRVVNFAGDAVAHRPLRRRHDHRGPSAFAARRSSPTRTDARPDRRRGGASPSQYAPAPRIHGEIAQLPPLIAVPSFTRRAALALAASPRCRLCVRARRAGAAAPRQPATGTRRRRRAGRRDAGPRRERRPAPAPPRSRRRRRAAAAARPEAVRRSDQGREGDRRACSASGRRTTRPGSRSRRSSSTGSTSSPSNLTRGHRREVAVRRHDGRQRRRRRSAGRATTVQLVARKNAVLRAAGHARGARGARRRSPTACSRRPRRLAAASRAQVGADRGQRAAARRHSRRQRLSSSAVPAAVFVRRAQLGASRARAPTAEQTTLQGLRALRAGARRSSRRRRPAAAPFTPPPSTVPDVRSLFLGFHYSFAKLPDEPMRPRARRRPAGLLHDDALRLHQRQRAHAARHLRQPLAPREEGPGRGAVGAEAADRVLARPEHSRSSYRAHGDRRASSSGTRRSSASASRTRSQAKLQPDDADWDTPTRGTRRCAG